MDEKTHTGTYQQVYRQLKDEILHLELPPGTSIGEIETAARFQTSRTPCCYCCQKKILYNNLRKCPPLFCFLWIFTHRFC